MSDAMLYEPRTRSYMPVVNDLMLKICRKLKDISGVSIHDIVAEKNVWYFAIPPRNGEINWHAVSFHPLTDEPCEVGLYMDHGMAMYDPSEIDSDWYGARIADELSAAYGRKQKYAKVN